MNTLHFRGNTFKYLKLSLVNFLMIVLSLTLLYPKAMIRDLKYLFSELTLGEKRFTYSGNQKKYFLGYLSTLCLIIFAAGILFGFGVLLNGFFKELPIATNYFVLLAYAMLLVLLLPLIVYGSIAFHSNAISWQSISVIWDGKRSDFVPLYIQGCILNILTLGIYTAWFQVNLSKYYLSHLKFGDLQFDFSGQPKALFKIYLKGFLLGVLTLGIYNIWTFKKQYNYTINNIVVSKGAQTFKLYSNVNTLEAYEMFVGNFLICVLSLGLASPWAYLRYFRFITNHCGIPEAFKPEMIEQNETSNEQADAPSHWLDRLKVPFIV